MSASSSIKVCPFCLVDARTDAASCAYCGSSYDHVGTPTPHADGLRTRWRTYDGVAAHDAEASRISVYPA